MTPEQRYRAYTSRVTPRMMLLEMRHKGCCGRAIEELILHGIREDAGEYVHLARRWGLSPSTIRRWIDALGLAVETARIREDFGRSTRGIFPADFFSSQNVPTSDDS